MLHESTITLLSAKEISVKSNRNWKVYVSNLGAVFRYRSHVAVDCI